MLAFSNAASLRIVHKQHEIPLKQKSADIHKTLATRKQRKDRGKPIAFQFIINRGMAQQLPAKEEAECFDGALDRAGDATRHDKHLPWKSREQG